MDRQNFTLKELEEAFKAGAYITTWNDFGYEPKWSSFQDWYKEIHIKNENRRKETK